MLNKNFNENSFPRKEVKDGVTSYYNEKGELHRDNGPAVISKSGAIWVCNGKMHREDGPALEIYDREFRRYNQWWIDGKQMTREEFEAYRAKTENKTIQRNFKFQ